MYTGSVCKETPQRFPWLTGYASICIPRLDGSVEMDQFAQLDGLTDGVATAYYSSIISMVPLLSILRIPQ
jgi:hypothetical protein